jgi:hypothetical protein
VSNATRAVVCANGSCGATFTPYRPTTRFCSVACRRSHRRTELQPCKVPGCSVTPSSANPPNYCDSHYARFRRYGDPMGGGSFYLRDAERHCSVNGCERPYHAGGYCGMHWGRVKHSGDPGAVDAIAHGARRKKVRPACSVDGCDRPNQARGYCPTHYAKWKRYGDPLAGRTKEHVWPDGHIVSNGDGYLRIKTPAGWVQHHRYVMEQTIGRPLKPFENVHHVNGVRDDNRPENLELWTKPQPAGQRAIDLAEWVAANYPELVQQVAAKESHR